MILRAAWALAVGVLLVGSACSSGSPDDGPTATVPRETTTTNPYAVPEVIDVAYVNRVLAGLDQAMGEVVRLVVSNRTISEEAIERLTAFLADGQLVLKLQQFQRDSLESFAGYRTPPGNKKTVVASLITVRPDCIFAEVRRDFSAVSIDADPTLSRQWVGLIPLDSSRNWRRYNPTPWMVAVDGFNEDLSQPGNPCES